METEKHTREGLALIAGIIGVVASVGAGLYLLSSGSASPEATVFDSIMHGMGAYFIARGAWMLRGLAGK